MAKKSLLRKLIFTVELYAIVCCKSNYMKSNNLNWVLSLLVVGWHFQICSDMKLTAYARHHHLLFLFITAEKRDHTPSAWLANACSNFLNQVQGRNKVIYNSTYWQVMASTKTKRVYRPIPSSLCQEDIIPDARKGIKCRKYFFEKVRQIK